MQKVQFAKGIASQEYFVAEEGALRAHEQECTHWYVDASLPTDHVHEWSAQRRGALSRLAETLGVAPILHGNFRASLATEVPEIRAGTLAYMTEELRLAHDLAAPLIIHGGVLVDPRPTESGRWSALQRFLRMTEEILKAAERLGVEVWVENLSHYPRYKPFIYVFTRYADYVAAREYIPEATYIFDVGHANVNQSPPLQLFKELGANLKAISVSDNDGRTDSHIGLGRGNVPIGQMLEQIELNDWAGIVAFETRGATIPEGVQALRDLSSAQTS